VVEVGSHLYARAAAKANSAEKRWARLRGGAHRRLSSGHMGAILRLRLTVALS